MTEKEILEGNRMIAEFMGGKFYEDTTTILESHVVSPAGNAVKCIDKLKYHSSWDWLMPVVLRIQDIDVTPAPNYSTYRIEMVVLGYVKIEGRRTGISIFKNVSQCGGFFNALWQAVVEFITQYNLENNKHQQTQNNEN